MFKMVKKFFQDQKEELIKSFIEDPRSEEYKIVEDLIYEKRWTELRNFYLIKGKKVSSHLANLCLLETMKKTPDWLKKDLESSYFYGKEERFLEDW